MTFFLFTVQEPVQVNSLSINYRLHALEAMGTSNVLLYGKSRCHVIFMSLMQITMDPGPAPKTLQEWRSQKLHPAGPYPRSVWTPLESFSSHMVISYDNHHLLCTKGLQTMRRVRLMVLLTEPYTAGSNPIHRTLT